MLIIVKQIIVICFPTGIRMGLLFRNKFQKYTFYQFL